MELVEYEEVLVVERNGEIEYVCIGSQPEDYNIWRKDRPRYSRERAPTSLLYDYGSRALIWDRFWPWANLARCEDILGEAVVAAGGIGAVPLARGLFLNMSMNHCL